MSPSFLLFRPHPPPILTYGFVATPFGRAFLVFADDACAALGFGTTAEPSLRQQLARQWPQSQWREAKDAVAQQTQAVFSARPVKLVVRGTDFQRKVWQALLAIPKGETRSYGALAKTLQTSPRALGGAVGKNPISLLIPCHRVVGGKGGLHGYRWGLQVKRALLEAEGAAS